MIDCNLRLSRHGELAYFASQGCGAVAAAGNAFISSLPAFVNLAIVRFVAVFWQLNSLEVILSAILLLLWIRGGAFEAFSGFRCSFKGCIAGV